MKPIKNILVPTDFSATAQNAFVYAQYLAEILGAKITVAHVSEWYSPISDLTVAPVAVRSDTEILEAMNSFIAFDSEKEASLTQKVPIETTILRGGVVDAIVGKSEDEDTDLIVMGNTGLQDFLSKIIGTVSLEVSQKAICPVLLVPRDVVFKPIKRIMYGVANKTTTPEKIRTMSAFAALFGASIHFVHINDNKLDDDRVIDSVFNELIEFSEPHISFEIHSIFGGDAVSELAHYATSHDIDLMSFVSEHRSFWQNLVHRSVTQNVAISATKPVLVMHLDDRN